MHRMILLGFFLIILLPLGQSQSLIIKSSTKGSYIRLVSPIYKWQAKDNSSSFRSLGFTGIRFSFGICDGLEIIGEGRINRVIINNQEMISGGNLAMGIRHNFYKALSPIEFPRYVSVTLFSNFHSSLFNKNFGYFLLYKKSANKITFSSGISHRIIRSLTLSLEALTTWNKKEPKKNFVEPVNSHHSRSDWIGLAFIYHIH